MTEREFEALVVRYERLVYTICYQLVRHEAQAQDLMQDTFLSVWAHRTQCPQEATSARAWVCRIAANKAKDALKSAYSRRVCACDTLPEQCCTDTDQPQQRTELADSASAARAAAEQLAEPYRTVSLLYFFKHKTSTEIAALLQRPYKTVNTQLYRAKQLLRTQLAEYL